METLYADGIGNIRLVDGVVRFDLVNIAGMENEKANLRPAGAVAMSIPALLRTHDQLTKTINKMVEDGVLKKNVEAATENTES